MTTFSDADLDRLADFVGGALDGTPEADTVRRLVATDAAWAEAYASLVTADATVRGELSSLAAEPLVLPDDVRVSLERALEALGATGSSSSSGAPWSPPSSAPPSPFFSSSSGGPTDLAGSPAAPVVDLARVRAQRRRRWVGAVAAAAAVLVCGGLGVAVVVDNRDRGGAGLTTSDSGRNEAGPRAPDAGSGPGAPSASSSVQRQLDRGNAAVVVSGRDYGPQTVGQVVVQASSVSGQLAGGDSSGGAGTVAPTVPKLSGVPDPLRRLADPAARAACLNAVTGEYGGRVALVDFASFEGAPALVVVVDGSRLGAGRRLVVVVGPDCGLGGAIADERYRAIA